MNAPDDWELQALLQQDAAMLRAQSPSLSPLLTWHLARQQAAHRLERRLRLASGTGFLLAALALAPILWRQPLTLLWLPTVAAVFWPLLRLLPR
jgi:hypothetical protein